MRYWKLIDSNRVIAVNIFMSPLRWVEISKEEFDVLVLLRKEISCQN